jgi:hypothetical protein
MRLADQEEQLLKFILKEFPGHQQGIEPGSVGIGLVGCN